MMKPGEKEAGRGNSSRPSCQSPKRAVSQLGVSPAEDGRRESWGLWVETGGPHVTTCLLVPPHLNQGTLVSLPLSRTNPLPVGVMPLYRFLLPHQKQTDLCLGMD